MISVSISFRELITEFKSPEKWDSDNDLSTQSDIYSFGIVLYSLLAGRVPFVFNKGIAEAEAMYNLMNAHKKDMPEPIFNLRKMAFEASHPGETYQKDYPDWLEKIILKCLEKDPQKRYKDGKELHDDYLKHANNPVLANTPINKSIEQPTPIAKARIWKDGLNYQSLYSNDNDFIYFYI